MGNAFTQILNGYNDAEAGDSGQIGQETQDLAKGLVNLSVEDAIDTEAPAVV